jgi:hypothetical protein
VFPVRYELNLYILIRRNSVCKGLSTSEVFMKSEDRTGWSSGKVLNLCKVYVGFESRPQIVFLSPSN